MNLPKSFRLKSSVVFPLLTLIVSLLITYQVVNTVKIDVEQKTQVYFDFRVREVIGLINHRMQAYEQVLRGTAGIYKISNSVERNEFKQYVETLNLAKNYAGVQGVGFSLIVPATKKTQHIASIRSEGFPEYTIRPEGQRETYSSIIYLEPFSGRNLRVFGYDMLAEPVHHAALQKAVDSGQPTLSGKVRLLQETGKQEQAGFLMYLPIYRNGTNNNILSERREHILGWVYLPFRMNDLMKGLFGEHANDLDIRIFDGEGMSDEALMYDSNDAVKTPTKFHITQHILIADHPWTIHIRPLPLMRLRVDANHPELVAAIGTILSVLLSLLIWSLVTGRERAINAAKRMNSDLINERQRLSSIIEGTHVGTWEWNVQTGETNFNNYWANIIGYELSELEPTSIETWMKFVHPDDAKLSGALLEKHFSGGLAYYECEARMRHKDGRWIWVLDRGKVTTWTPDGKPLMMSGTHQEISERKQAESELKIAATAFESQEGMIVTDAYTIILRVNNAFTAITGYTSEEAVGQTPRLLSSGRQDKAFYEAMWERLNQTGAWEGESWNRRKSGEVYPEHLTISAVKDASGIVTNYVATLTDITMSKVASDAIKTFAFYDQLTQLPNRRLLLDRLSQTMSASKRNKTYGALMFLDLDNFKPLNDTHGHLVGDMLLIEAANRLTSCMRDMDTVARFGGDEFVVMLAELDEDKTASTAQAAIVAEKIRAVLSEPYVFTITHEGQADTTVEHHCTASIGVMMFIDDESSQDDIMKWADAAMYEAKDAGRNQIRFYGEKA